MEGAIGPLGREPRGPALLLLLLKLPTRSFLSCNKNQELGAAHPEAPEAIVSLPPETLSKLEAKKTHTASVFLSPSNF